MSNVAIIPARGGSKRIYRKNIKDFFGKPIISYSINAAIRSGLFDEIMVSTEDEEIAKIAEFHGAKVPFFRSIENASDFATTSDVLIEVINEYKKQKIFFTNACCIYPTAPFVTEELLSKAYSQLLNENLNSVVPIVQFSCPIQRAFRLNKNKIEMIEKKYINSRTQDLIPTYHDAGQFYFFNIENFILTKSLWTKNTGYVEIKETEIQDIDNEIDWSLAELKYELLKKNHE